MWLPAAIWLYRDGATGRAVFLVVWGVLGVSMADIAIKGGALAFAFLGVFIGPTLLVVSSTVLRDGTIGAPPAHTLALRSDEVVVDDPHHAENAS